MSNDEILVDNMSSNGMDSDKEKGEIRSEEEERKPTWIRSSVRRPERHRGPRPSTHRHHQPRYHRDQHHVKRLQSDGDPILKMTQYIGKLARKVHNLEETVEWMNKKLTKLEDMGRYTSNTVYKIDSNVQTITKTLNYIPYMYNTSTNYR